MLLVIKGWKYENKKICQTLKIGDRFYYLIKKN